VEAERFDTLVRSLTAGLSRRGLLRIGVASLAASAVTARVLGMALEVDAKKKKKKKKKKCQAGSVFCKGNFCCASTSPVCCPLSLGGGCCSSSAPNCCQTPTGFACCP
jgi:hypothetical protein